MNTLMVAFSREEHITVTIIKNRNIGCSSRPRRCEHVHIYYIRMIVISDEERSYVRYRNERAGSEVQKAQ